MERRIGYRILVAKHHGSCPLGEPLWRCGNNIKMDIGQVVKIGSRWNWFYSVLCGILISGFATAGPAVTLTL
jgi:hypothetical protein